YDPRNTHSGKVMEKCGLKYEGTLRSCDKNNSGICDTSWYGILRNEYFNR
ncbi:MAG: GNAT family protein, partial [Clostridium sp.]|nr:GNAT family protein [Clostridium sp.]